MPPEELMARTTSGQLMLMSVASRLSAQQYRTQSDKPATPAAQPESRQSFKNMTGREYWDYLDRTGIF